MTFKSLDHDGGERAEAVEHLHEDEGPGHVPEVRRVDLITHTHTHARKHAHTHACIHTYVSILLIYYTTITFELYAINIHVINKA
jgi:hypothetical protein